MILIGYKNTLLYLVCGTTLSLFLTSLGAYALSRKNLYGKNFIMMMIAFTMFFGGGMVPTFLLVKNLHMVDTPFAMFVPIALSSWNLIIMRTSFQAMPESLIESAKIDGANDFIILFKLVLPLSLPIIAVMILYYGVGYWNDYMTPLLYLRAREKYPIQLVLRDILLSNSNNEAMTQGVASDSAFQIGENIKYATIIVSTLPILLVYPFIQKYFVQGVMIGAIKE
jgi:putative aldouronate transport system permease protein